ncbi:hypothetical protein RVR_4947 [Actinacidiphila reveromycinica]|uniref:Lipoprotein n=1 Tax=Actinacidiphila reveromycinica TaxID=659352 RepID=A0A7U3UTV7_9ACTN|nr:hypothetical protein [Streptomyces sp. SN-593]BBA98669.1 hypothetical protein RVR_4947 [Streptomyces sp. SN-593]
MRVRHRTLAALLTTVPLAFAMTACSDSSAGQVTGTRGLGFSQTIANPTQGDGACHRFAPRGVDHVTNNTGVDIWLHKGLDCKDPAGRPSTYLPTTFSAGVAETPGLWHSFSTVGWPPPVPPNVGRNLD